MPNHPRLSEALDDYLNLRRARYAASTVTNEAFVLRRFIANVGDIQVRNLQPHHVESWFYGPNDVRAAHKTRDGRERDSVEPSTHNYYRSRLKSYFRYCSARGWTARTSYSTSCRWRFRPRSVCSLAAT